MPEVIVLGLSLAQDHDFFLDREPQVGASMRYRRGQQCWGGKGWNVAQCLDKAGVPTSFYSFDPQGQFQASLMPTETVHIQIQLAELPALPRQNIKCYSLHHDGYQLTEFNEEAQALPEAVLAPAWQVLYARLEEQLELLARARRPIYLLWTGSFPYGLSGDVLLAFLELGRRYGAQIGLDHFGAAGKRAIEQGLVDWVKPNGEEAQMILASYKEASFGDRNVEEVLLDYAAERHLHILYSQGASGATLLTSEGHTYHEAALPLDLAAEGSRQAKLKPLRLVGAGDSMVAAVLRHLWRGGQWDPACLHAALLAARDWVLARSS